MSVAQNPPGSMPPSGEAGGARILLADDDESVRQFMWRALVLAGYRVVAVADAAGALEQLAAYHGAFDLLLTDIVMPGMDGIALALKVASDYPDVPILMMTGYAHERQRAVNLDMLADRVIDKPFSLTMVLDAVARALAMRQVKSPPPA
jgi:two-component system, cell cycle response regulator CpdR